MNVTFGCEPADWGFVGLPGRWVDEEEDMPDWEDTLTEVN